MPGPDEEQQLVLKIYRLFTSGSLRESQIAEMLNKEGVASEGGGAWTRSIVHQILTNEKYIGNNVYNRISYKLKKKRVHNAPDMWVRAEQAFEPIVDPALFYTARGIIHERHRSFTTEEMLERLRALMAESKHLSARLIDEADGMPSSSIYRSRFGGLVGAYRAVGYDVDRDYTFLEINRRLRAIYPDFLAGTQHQLAQVGAAVQCDPRNQFLRINDEYTATILLTRCRQTTAGAVSWCIQQSPANLPDSRHYL